MSEIEFTPEEKALLVQKLKKYFNDELDQEVGQFEAEFFLDFISDELGAYYYNRGIEDARIVFQNQLDNIDEALYAIEKDT